MPDIESAPEEIRSNRPAPIPRMRRTLRSYRQQLTTTVSALVAIDRGETPKDPGAAWAVLACEALLETWPPRSEIEPRVEQIAETQRDRLVRYSAAAKETLEAEFATCISALRSLDFMDAIGEPVPELFDNLPPHRLARELNQLGFTIARGRIPGWKD